MEGILSGFETFDNLTGGLSLHKNYLVLGDKESGKETFLYKLVQNALQNKFGVLYITISKPASEIVSDLLKVSPSISTYLGQSLKLIDDFSRSISGQATDNAYTKVLNGPLDLTGLSVAMSSINSDFIKDGYQVINVLNSVSSLLLYNNNSTVFRFLQFVCGRSKISGATSIYALDENMHAPEVTETTKSLMDGIIKLKLGDDGKRYFTATGIEKEVLAWSPLQ